MYGYQKIRCAAESQAQDQSGPGSLQRSPQESGKGKVNEDDKIIETCERKEAQLYAHRGYGGYINSEELQEIRSTKADAIRRRSKRLGITDVPSER